MRCWTCGAVIDDEEWKHAPREASDEKKRWCASCHFLVDVLDTGNARRFANMIRYAAGVPRA